MKRHLVWLGWLMLGIDVATAGTPAIQQLIAAEREFNEQAQRNGVRSAFLEAMAPTAVLFRPGPVDGPAWQTARGEAPFDLSWCPAQAVISAAGDLGATFGPWSLSARPAATNSTHGIYFTVWERRPDDRFKFIADHGISGQSPPCPEQVAVLDSGEALPDPDKRAARSVRWQALQAADRERNQGFDRAPLARWSLQEAGGPAAEAAGSDGMHTTGLRMAASADLAISFGALGEPARSGYLRLWVFRDEGWQLLIERRP